MRKTYKAIIILIPLIVILFYGFYCLDQSRNFPTFFYRKNLIDYLTDLYERTVAIQNRIDTILSDPELGTKESYLIPELRKETEILKQRFNLTGFHYPDIPKVEELVIPEQHYYSFYEESYRTQAYYAFGFSGLLAILFILSLVLPDRL